MRTCGQLPDAKVVGPQAARHICGDDPLVLARGLRLHAQALEADAAGLQWRRDDDRCIRPRHLLPEQFDHMFSSILCSHLPRKCCTSCLAGHPRTLDSGCCQPHAVPHLIPSRVPVAALNPRLPQRMQFEALGLCRTHLQQLCKSMSLNSAGWKCMPQVSREGNHSAGCAGSAVVWLTSLTTQPYLRCTPAASSSAWGSSSLPPAILKTRASVAGSMDTMPVNMAKGA